MTWTTILGLFALFGLLVLLGLAAAIIRRRNKTIIDLQANVDRLQTQLNSTDAAITKLNKHDAALRAKLEEMHLAAMRFCANARGIYYAGELAGYGNHTEGWESTRSSGRGVDYCSGSAWYGYYSHPDRLTEKTPEQVASYKPSVEEWIEFANSISAYAEANSWKWWEQVRLRDFREMSQRNRQRVAQESAVIFARAIRKATAPMDEKALLKLSDDMLLGVLAWISKEASPGSSGWDAKEVIRFFNGTRVADAYLSVMLNDLVKHRNAEFTAVIDGMPPDIANYFLRLTIAEPVAAAG